jgi:hypothetical protein
VKRRGLVLAGVAAIGPACAIALGVEDDPSLAAAVLCGCDPFTDLPACQPGLEARIERATPDLRARWLQDFGTKCKSSCPAMPTCFYEAPACVHSGDNCADSRECCSFYPDGDAGACDDGVCN